MRRHDNIHLFFRALLYLSALKDAIFILRSHDNIYLFFRALLYLSALKGAIFRKNALAQHKAKKRTIGQGQYYSTTKLESVWQYLSILQKRKKGFNNILDGVMDQWTDVATYRVVCLQQSKGEIHYLSNWRI